MGWAIPSTLFILLAAAEGRRQDPGPGPGPLYILRREEVGNPSKYFHKSWEEYKEGFFASGNEDGLRGTVHGEFWAGLDRLYKLTNWIGLGRHKKISYYLNITLIDFDQKKYIAVYDHFKVGPEEDDYMLTVGGFNEDLSSLGDSMASVNGMKFTTKDRDNDEHKHTNCANLHGGGWWYKACTWAHLTGMHTRGRRMLGDNSQIYFYHSGERGNNTLESWMVVEMSLLSKEPTTTTTATNPPPLVPNEPTATTATTTEINPPPCNENPCRCDTSAVDVSSFCANLLQSPIANGYKREFCGYEFTKKQAVLNCPDVSAAVAKELLRSSSDAENVKYCNFEVDDLLTNRDCGKLLQDKLNEDCDRDCKKFENKISSTAAAVLEIYEEKENEVNVMVEIQTRIKDVVEVAREVAKAKEETTEIRNDRPKILEQLLDKINKSKILTKESKERLTKSVEGAMEFDAGSTTSYKHIITSTKNEIRVLTDQQDNLDKSKSKMKKQFDKVRRGWTAMRGDTVGTVQKASVALDNIVGAVGKFQKGGALDVAGGILDIGNAITQFLPPPASIITGSISSIFNILVGNAPATDPVKEGFEKQKKWMDKKFDGIELKLDNLENRISSLLIEQAKKDEKNMMIKYTKDKIGEAKGILKEFKLKQDYIFSQQNKILQPKIIRLMIIQLDLFKNSVEKFQIKEFVKDTCTGREELDIIEACQLLAFTSLMVDLQEEKLIDQTLAMIGSSSYSVLSASYLDYKETLKQDAKSFFEVIFLNPPVEARCDSSHRPLAQLESEQKGKLVHFAEHLEPGLGVQLKEKEAELLRKWNSCGVIISGGSSWRYGNTTETFSSSSYPSCYIPPYYPSLLFGRSDHNLAMFGEKTLVACGPSPINCVSWSSGDSDWQEKEWKRWKYNGFDDGVSYYNAADKKFLMMEDKTGFEMPGGRTFSLKHTVSQACLIPGRDHFVITGGLNGKSAYPDVYMYSRNGLHIRDMPSLRQARNLHACASYEDQNGETVLLVAGGVDTANWDTVNREGDGYRTVEILKAGAHAWTEGPMLPQKLYRARAVRLGGNVLLSGGISGSHIEQLKDGSNVTAIGNGYVISTPATTDQILRLSDDHTSWDTVGRMKEARVGHSMTAVDFSAICG